MNLENNKTFVIKFDSNYLTPTDVVIGVSRRELKVLTKPKRPTAKLLLQYLTFGWYQAPWYYKLSVQE
jgi:hypothetical protein